jgi:hypothetical protein
MGNEGEKKGEPSNEHPVRFEVAQERDKSVDQKRRQCKKQ